MKIKLLAIAALGAFATACASTPPAEDTTPVEPPRSVEPADTGANQPAGPIPGTTEHFVQTAGDRVFFDLDRNDLSAEGRETLRRQAAWLASYPDARILIAGNCDERGTRDYNLALGERRANAAKNYLVSIGIPANRIRTVSYGKERPVALGSNEAAWAQNRRAATVTIG